MWIFKATKYCVLHGVREIWFEKWKITEISWEFYEIITQDDSDVVQRMFLDKIRTPPFPLLTHDGEEWKRTMEINRLDI